MSKVVVTKRDYVLNHLSRVTAPMSRQAAAAFLRREAKYLMANHQIVEAGIGGGYSRGFKTVKVLPDNTRRYNHVYAIEVEGSTAPEENSFEFKFNNPTGKKWSGK